MTLAVFGVEASDGGEVFAEEVLVEHAGGDELGVGARVQVHGGLHLLEGVEDVLWDREM